MIHIPYTSIVLGLILLTTGTIKTSNNDENDQKKPYLLTLTTRKPEKVFINNNITTYTNVQESSPLPLSFHEIIQQINQGNIDLLPSLLNEFLSQHEDQSAEDFFDNLKDPLTGTPILTHSIIYQQFSLTKWLLNNKADINQPDNKGNTPLMEAVRINNPDLVDFLCNYHADPTPINTCKKNALQLAIESKNTDIIQILKFHEQGIKKTDEYIDHCTSS